ncbi:MAG: aminotransferase class V-fold PLP-dependent enzyme [Planctomycetes bacterium]|nr:aminotransferase class V-fold PLP-dependent enzyme [Planctomycetota bacterium]
MPETLKSEAELLAYREEFPILARRVYLINNSLGAMPRKVRDRMSEYCDAWDIEGVEAWWKWLPMVTEVGDLVGSIIGADKGGVMMHQNVATLTAMVLSALDFRGERNKIVYDDMQFTSPHYVLQAWARHGADVVQVKTKDNISINTDELCAAIDEKTLLVPISLVLFRSGYIHEVEKIIARAHEVGAHVLLDVYQGAGAVPIDVKALNVDFLVGGSVKFLCGGAGACYLYVRPDLRERYSPTMTGWFSHKRPFKFEHEMDEAVDMHRWMGGSPSVPALYSARSGYEIINAVGVASIRAKSMRQTQMVVDYADKGNMTVNSPRDPERRAGFVVVNFEGAEDVHHKLIENGFNIDYRPGAGIRIAPHFYNTDEEIDRIFAEIARLRA